MKIFISACSAMVVTIAALQPVHAQSAPSLLWDEDPASIVTGFAVSVDGARTDYGLTPLNTAGTCGCRITLPFSSGRHTLVVSAYNNYAEAASAPFVVGPTAAAGGPYLTQAGTPLTVNASATTDAFFTITNYTWNWGDGTASSTVATPTASHTYASAGMYTITLVVADDFPATHTSTTTATISAPQPAPPGTPSSPSPATGEQNVAVTRTLSWSSTGATAYALSFGTSDPPPLIASGITSPAFTPTMRAATTYYWKVAASNTAGTTDGPVWRFTTAAAAAPEVVVYASDVSAAAIHGTWTTATDSTSPAGTKLITGDAGIAVTAAPLVMPTHYVDVVFDAPAGVPYTLWLRMQALDNIKYNDSVWVQFSDALVNGLPVYPLDSAQGLLVNLAADSVASSLKGWGWQNSAYWLYQPATVTFASSGSHTVRIQVREDGVQFDQIVLSPTLFRDVSPGLVSNDSTIVPKPGAPAPVPPPPPAPATGPYLGSPVSLPGVVEAENFDNGPDGIAYHDMTPGNTGGQYRSTDADIENTAGGGYNIGWMSVGDWMNYAVNVTATGTYRVTFRVASAWGGGSLQVGFNGPLGVWQPISIPNTGGWQTWETVSLQVNLGAGSQLMTLLVNSEAFNLDSITVTRVP